MKKLTALLLALLVAFSAVGMGFAQESGGEVQPLEVQTQETTQEPTQEPTAEPTVEPTVEPTQEPEQQGDEVPPVPTEPTDENAVEGPSTEPTATPSADDDLEAETFTEGLVRLSAGTVLYADEQLTQALLTLAQNGVAYATANDEANQAATQLVYTIDGETVAQAYVATEAVTPLTPDELAQYTAQASTVSHNELPLFALVAQVPEGEDDSTLSDEQQPPIVQGLVHIAAGTVLYADDALATPLGTLNADGIVYLLPVVADVPLAICTTFDGVETASAWLAADTAYTALTQDELAAYAPTEGAAAYEGFTLPIIDIEKPLSYEMATYGLPGMPEGYELTAEELTDKKELKATLEQLETLEAGKEYVADEVIFTTASKEKAQLIAASYGGTLDSFEYGVAVIKLNGIDVLTAVRAAADESTRLVAVYPNIRYYLEEPPTDGGDIADFTHSDMGLLSDVPYQKTWADFKNDDPFLTNPANMAHYTLYSNIIGSNGYQYFHDTIDSYAAWGLTTGSDIVNVGVIDTLVLDTHEDFGQGKVTQYSSLEKYDDGHGTHVAGTIAATKGNGLGGSGVAPGVKVMAYATTFYTDDIASGLYKLCDEGAWVINMSLGGNTYDKEFEDAVEACIDAGIPVVAAAGNDSGMLLEYPAGYEDVISVASTDPSNQRSPSSTFGTATISAPGSYIISTHCDKYDTSVKNLYQSYNGTSMAAPVVTGVVALYYSAIGTRDVNGDGDVDRDDVVALTKVLTSNTTKINGSAKGMGAGIVNAGNIFRKIVSKPTISLSGATDKNTVPSSAEVVIETGYNGDYVLYTLDGKNPSVKNGAVVYGTRYTGAISLTGMPVGKVTVKALSVNAQGVVSKVASYSFTIDNVNPTSITIDSRNTMLIALGKIVTLTATVTPASKSIKPVWSVVSGNATIGKSNGKLSLTKAAQVGQTITVQAAITPKGGTEIKSATYKLTVVSPVTKVEILDAGSIVLKKTQTVYVNDTAPVRTLYPRVTLANKEVLEGEAALNRVGISYTGGMEAYPNQGTVMVYAKGAGNGKVILTANDGSNKKGTLGFKALQYVEAITLNAGATSSLAIGKSRTLKATVLPKNAANKKVEWSIEGTAPTGVKLSKGKVSIANDTSLVGTTFTVVCKALDGSLQTASHTITITAPVTALTLATTDPKAVYNKRSVLTGATLFTQAITGSTYDDATTNNETEIQLTANTTGNANAAVLWTTSNPKVATVSQSGLVTAVGKGRATITCTTQDGTNRKATLKATVIIPVSNVNIMPNTASMGIMEFGTLAFGKSASYKTVFGQEYGAPTNKKVKWSAELRYYENFSSCVYGGLDNTENYTAITEPKFTKEVSISSSGKLSVKRGKLYTDWENVSGDYVVKVTATAADGSGAKCSHFMALTRPTTFMKGYKGYVAVYNSSGDYLTTIDTSLKTVTAKLPETDQDVENDKIAIGYAYFTTNFYAVDGVPDVVLTAGNPTIASPIDVGRVGLNKVAWYVKHNGKLYPLYVVRYKGDKAGTTSIKVSINDGCKKSVSFKVRVIE